MLIFDELKKNDPQLRLVAVVLAAGLGILLAGLWWVQIVSAREYQSHLETQSYRTVRIPAARGKILDRHGRVLAENRPRYDLSLYLDDLRKEFTAEYTAEYAARHQRPRPIHRRAGEKARTPLTKAERKLYALTTPATGTTARAGALPRGWQRRGTTRPPVGPAVDARHGRI